jgi:NADPH:quinone reductase-like Zn-dependent oxidoreductase
VKPSLIPLSDGAGEVVEIGAGVTRVKVGDRVAGCFFQRWIAGPMTADTHASALGGGIDGMLAEYVVLEEHGVVKVATHLSYEEAATLPCAAVTAWHALAEHARIVAGETVLVQGTGGVSIFALQLARLMGARVIVTSSSDQKLARARELGAAHGVNYKSTPEWDKAVVAWTGGGVDHIVEVGGPGTLAQSLRAIRIGQDHADRRALRRGRDQPDADLRAPRQPARYLGWLDADVRGHEPRDCHKRAQASGR